VAHWPEVETDHLHKVHIITGALCHGQAIRDIDLLVLASLGPGLRYDTFIPFTDSAENRQTPRGVEVRSLCLAIEVKDHPMEKVRFTGTRALVRYDDGWKDATEQSFRQTHSVARYLRSNRVPVPFVSNLLWLRNVAEADLPRRPHPIIGARLTWELLLNVVALNHRPRKEGARYFLRSLPADEDPGSLTQAAELFTKQVEPTRLDRLRLERLHQRDGELAPLLEQQGKRLVLLRGRGGTGKTMRLLQIANHLAEVQGERVLILTYNRALVADVRRLLTILGMRDDVGGGTIHIRTVHGFMYAVLTALGFFDRGEADFLEHYEELKEEALSFIESGALSAAELAEHAMRDPLTFGWRVVLVDEGQDWPDNERKLLGRLIGHQRLVVADGIEQMVRSNVPADWRRDVPEEELKVVALRKTLRMKSVPARFASALASELGLLQHTWPANEDMPGGRVIILDRPYFADRAFHEALVQQAVDDGNLPVDLLLCVPPGATRPSVADRLALWGSAVWDGTNADVRQSYPTSADQLRLVHYESCRGLEGWSVVMLGMDRFYAHRLALAEREYADDPDLARQNAARWMMIAVTRAIDTLVIELDGCSEGAGFRAALERAARGCGEAVEWGTGGAPDVRSVE